MTKTTLKRRFSEVIFVEPTGANCTCGWLINTPTGACAQRNGAIHLLQHKDAQLVDRRIYDSSTSHSPTGV